ncbi:SsgA family sporulation/cell division regulator [Nocardioides mangrovicus]|uniref:SsgA family sporulation/cell division regulator n=1 Tax=Nocardioides mangrovicus TaxID=2478913 RepID=A0A3L8P4G5_9ACTN|nr:SsgA family sporulation/cell division regulator [Nocardioides mangrovicus]RLV50175.1 SsgA family sporulation/cell division regulator [Nocardioides mangrovicus]
MKRNTRSTVISELVELDFVDDEGRRACLDAEMVYDRRDPFAMSMVFKTLPPVTWTFSRELVMTGMYEPAGDGDVHVWPCLSGDGEAVVIFEFCSPDGEVLVQAGLREVARFVHRMLDSVPQGSEEQFLDIDETINQLLGEAGDIAV